MEGRVSGAAYGCVGGWRWRWGGEDVAEGAYNVVPARHAHAHVYGYGYHGRVGEDECHVLELAAAAPRLGEEGP